MEGYGFSPDRRREPKKPLRGRDGAGARSSKPRFRRKKICRLCADHVVDVDYKDAELLLKFLTEKGKIIPRRITGNCTRHQRILARAVKRSRHGAVIPFQIM
ncbi:MAG: 30S ribosomal protein S18 [Candidatus Omnitrophica bacterium]|nr:30S ribosomal protein S18 [Candidatus Omnitrophota bacterium]